MVKLELTPDSFPPMILGFDPGRDKCGLAVMGVDRKLHYHEVVPAEAAISTIKALSQSFPIVTVVMGDQTTAKLWKKKLNRELAALPVVLVDERFSSLEARDRYWKMYPPQGLQCLIPQGLRQPPRPVDDIVAILLIERYLKPS
ncbi:MAG: Holliday junction resolvase RuvX [Chamaesiphon sp.]